VVERVYVPAENNQIELEQAQMAVEELTSLVGTMTSATMRSTLTEQLRALDYEMQRLEATPSREAGWDYRKTGSTYADVWLNSLPDEKRKLIIDKGITARVIKEGSEIHFYIETQKSPSAG
jgi:hypothetical protein